MGGGPYDSPVWHPLPLLLLEQHPDFLLGKQLSSPPLSCMVRAQQGGGGLLPSDSETPYHRGKAKGT